MMYLKRQILAGVMALLLFVALLPGVGMATSVMSLSSDAVAVYAKEYTVSFYENNAQGAPVLYREEGFLNPQTVKDGALPVFPSGTPNQYTGNSFTGWNRSASQPITASTDVYAQYQAAGIATITIEYVSDQDNRMLAASRTMTVEQGAPFTSTFDAPFIEGYQPLTPDDEGIVMQAKGQNPADGYTLSISIDQPTGEYDYVVRYAPDLGARYIVNHYLQGLDGQYGEPTLSETKYGAAEELVQVALNEYEGFTAITAPETFANIMIAADGSTVIDLYYERNTYVLSYHLGQDGAFADGQALTEPLYYGEEIPQPQNPSRPGYQFTGWAYADGATYSQMPAGNVARVAQWEAGETTFTVEFWYTDYNPRDDGTYAYRHWYTEAFAADAGTEIVLDASDPYGFFAEAQEYNLVFDRYDEGLTVAANGGTVVNVYYHWGEVTQRYFVIKEDLVPGCVNGPANDPFTHIHTEACFTEVFSVTGRGGSSAGEALSAMSAPYVGLTWHEDMPLVGASVTGTELPIARDRNLYAYREMGNIWTFVINRYGMLADENGNMTGTTTLLGTQTQQTRGYMPVVTVRETERGYTLATPALASLDQDANGNYRAAFAADPAEPSIFVAGQADPAQPDTWVMDLYYEPIQYALTFSSLGSVVREETVAYSEPLGRFATFVPGAQAGFTFAGWYDNANFTGSPVDFETLTMDSWMPTFYAKWDAPMRTVTFDAQGGTGTPASTEVLAGAVIDAPATPVRQGYTFGGWYREETFENRYVFSDPVQGDMTLYASWTADAGIPYTVHHRYRVNGVVTEESNILDKTYYGQMGEEITVQAAELDGYVPDRREKEIQLQSATENILTFYYEPIAEDEGIDYTVFYRDAENPEVDVLQPQTFTEREDAVVVARRAALPGYTPDAYEKSLMLSLDDANEITFAYRSNAGDAEDQPYTVTTYLESALEGGYHVKEERTESAPAGMEVSVTPEPPEGFMLDDELSVLSGVVRSDGTLNLSLYYKLPRVSYTVQYLDVTINEPVMEPVTRTDTRLGSRVEESAPDIEGYTFVSHGIGGALGGGKTLSTIVSTEDMVITFYYSTGSAMEDGDPDEDGEHTITSTTSEGGTVSPLGEMKVANGESQRYAFGSETGYQIDTLTVDDKVVYDRSVQGDVKTAATFTFTSVTMDHTIDVTYTAIDGSGQGDAEASYTLLIRHLVEATGATVAPDETQTLQPGTKYVYKPVQADGRSATHAVVKTEDGVTNITDAPSSATISMPKKNVTVTIYYTDTTATTTPTTEDVGDGTETTGEDTTGSTGGTTRGSSSGGGSSSSDDGSGEGSGGVSVPLNPETNEPLSMQEVADLVNEEGLEPLYVMLDTDIPLGGVAARNVGDCFE